MKAVKAIALVYVVIGISLIILLFNIIINFMNIYCKYFVEQPRDEDFRKLEDQNRDGRRTRETREKKKKRRKIFFWIFYGLTLIKWILFIVTIFESIFCK